MYRWRWRQLSGSICGGAGSIPCEFSYEFFFLYFPAYSLALMQWDLPSDQVPVGVALDADANVVVSIAGAGKIQVIEPP